MSDFSPKPADVKACGSSNKTQKLRALREKAEQANNGGNSAIESSTGSVKALAGTKKTSFNRKAV